MEGEPPTVELDPNREIPQYGRALQLLLEEAEREEMDKKSKPIVGLPERPHKQIKEKFRLDRENLERKLNAKGDSLYKSKLEEMQNPWAGAPSWGGQPQSPPWAGWPAEPRQNKFGGWGLGSDAQESPFGRNQGENSNEQSSGFGSKSDDKSDSDNEFNVDKEDGDDNDDGYIQPDNDDDSAFQKAREAFEKGETSAQFDESGNSDDDSDDNAAEDSDGDARENEESTYGEEDMALMEDNDGAENSYTSQELNSEDTPSNDPNLDPYGRPKKRLKEKFMRDREELERMMNAKGDSIYRKASDPPPGAVATTGAPPTDGSGPPPGYGGGKVMGPDELRAQMALQKIARAALRAASKRKGRRGKASVVFI